MAMPVGRTYHGNLTDHHKHEKGDVSQWKAWRGYQISMHTDGSWRGYQLSTHTDGYMRMPRETL